MYDKIYKQLGLLYCINKEVAGSELTEKYTGRPNIPAILQGKAAIWQSPAKPEIWAKKRQWGHPLEGPCQ